jgi:fructosamine-3-kinase
MIPPSLTSIVLSTLRDAGERTPISRVEQMRRGRVSSSWRIVTGRRSYLLKFHPNPRPYLYSYEQFGLGALRAAGARTPRVLAAADARDGEPAYCLQEWIAPGSTEQFARRLGPSMGEHLAAIHLVEPDTPGFGSGYDSVRGPCPRWFPIWAESFREGRLRPRIEAASAANALSAARRRGLERLLEKVDAILGSAGYRASLLHGDLHGANVLCDRQGRPVLIDPCVYWGDREAELAYTTLWGGFAPGFYRAYNAAWPLDEGYAERRDLYVVCDLLDAFAAGDSLYGRRIDEIVTRYVGYAGLT